MEEKTLKYDNMGYWTHIHKRYQGSLQAVGHPMLCYRLNELKYASEADTIVTNLQDMKNEFRRARKKDLSILDVGAGVGYWSKVIRDAFDRSGFRVKVTALDISQEALKILRRNNPHFQTVRKDLKTIDPDLFGAKFDLVISFYCLHHLVNVDDFLNALRFAGSSVSQGGFLMIMDPVLNLPFSRFDVIDFPSYTGNGIARHLYIYDDVLATKGFSRQLRRPAVSFLLNGNLEAYGWFSYHLAEGLWRVLSDLIYKSDRRVRALRGLLVFLDRVLKRLNLAFSSSVCVYQKST